MLRQELERVRPQLVPLQWKDGDNLIRILSISHRVLTEKERGTCIASVTLLIQEISDLRRSIRQCNRSIDNLQKRCASSLAMSIQKV